MVASGIISPKQMKIGMIITGIITFFIATVLIFMAFGNENFIISFIFFRKSIIAVTARILGKFIIVRNDGTTVSNRPKVLYRIKTGCTDIA